MLTLSWQSERVQRINAWLWGLPIFIATVFSIGLAAAFRLSGVWYLVIGLLVGVTIWQYTKRNTQYAPALAIACTVVTLAILFVSLYPSLEQYRPYPAIQKAIAEHQISEDVPMIIEERFIHNIPFYVQRKILQDQQYSWDDVIRKGMEEPVLALVKVEHPLPPEYQVLWQGSIYRKGSESHGFRFILHCWEASRGNYQHFQEYNLIYYNSQDTHQESPKKSPVATDEKRTFLRLQADLPFTSGFLFHKIGLEGIG